MTAESIKLIPCPFCGSSAKIFGGGESNFYAACTSSVCFCSLGEQYYPGDIPAHIFGNEESAAFNWNRRVEPILHSQTKAGITCCFCGSKCVRIRGESEWVKCSKCGELHRK
jgi:hypothetical protein